MIERIRLADAPRPLLPESPMLITESRDDFNRICAALNNEIKPRGIIQQMYVADIAALTWDILRAHRWKAAIINSEFLPALASLLERLLHEPGYTPEFYTREAEKLAKEWFTERSAKKRVSELLRKFQLDESAIEAEAFRMSAPDLEMLDRMLASYKSRRSKALRNIAECDVIFAQRLRDSSNRIIEGKATALEHKVGEPPSAAA